MHELNFRLRSISSFYERVLDKPYKTRDRNGASASPFIDVVCIIGMVCIYKRSRSTRYLRHFALIFCPLNKVLSAKNVIHIMPNKCRKFHFYFFYTYFEFYAFLNAFLNRALIDFNIKKRNILFFYLNF